MGLEFEDEALLETYEDRFCPEQIDDFIRVKNSYSNIKDRLSFQLEINKCDSSVANHNCHDDEDTKKLLKKVFFTLFLT